MTVGQIMDIILAEAAAQGDRNAPVSGCYVCDIMSRTIAEGFRGMAWITCQANMNALAVAVMKGAACVIFPEGIRPEEAVVRRAEEERMTLLFSELPAFELAGRLYRAGLRGEENKINHAEP